MKRYEQAIMMGTFLVLTAIWITIALSKLHALVFVTIVLAVGLGIREFTRRRVQAVPAAQPQPATLPAAKASPGLVAAPQAECVEQETFLGKTILVAARQWSPALNFALEETRTHGGRLLVLFVREVRILIDRRGDWNNDPQARKLFNRLISECRREEDIHKLYSISDSPADTIIDIAATFGVDTVVLGETRRSRLANLLRGNVVSTVATHLPEEMHLIVVG